MQRTSNVDVFTILFAGLSLRAMVSLHSYSGAKKPPLYGDYEAQRHWQEVTVNLPIEDWYRNTSYNDLLYWGLDYPPLTAYHSYLVGRYGASVNASFVALHESRGYESIGHKTFMRHTVILGDIFIFVPAVWLLCTTLEKVFKRAVALPCFIIFMLYPGQILIDNGHFQYNNISLGLAAAAIAYILKDSIYRGAFLFTLALNYKQMELYHALPFFFYILHSCCKQVNLKQVLSRLLLVSAIVVCTFALLWLPWIRSIDALSGVVRRLFPFDRGVFEDKVANFWCALNVIYKLKDRLPYQQMAFVCLSATLLVILPVNMNLFFKSTKSKFLYALANTAMAFFLFSFQVHEKSILLVALPAIALYGFMPVEVFWLLEVSSFSMVPLLLKDNLFIPYLALSVIFHILMQWLVGRKASGNLSTKLTGRLHTISMGCAISILIMSTVMRPPSKYPYLWPLLNALFSCFHFMLFLAYSFWCQIYSDRN